MPSFEEIAIQLIMKLQKTYMCGFDTMIVRLHDCNNQELES